RMADIVDVHRLPGISTGNALDRMVQHPRDGGGPPQAVVLKVDRSRLSPEDLPDERAEIGHGTATLPARDGDQGFLLLRVSALVGHDADLPIPIDHGPGGPKRHRKIEAVEVRG